MYFSIPVLLSLGAFIAFKYWLLILEIKPGPLWLERMHFACARILGGFASSFQGGFCCACMGSVKWERIWRKCFLSLILEGFSGPFSYIKILWMYRKRGTWPRIVTWLPKPELNEAVWLLLLLRFLGTHFVPCSLPHPHPPVLNLAEMKMLFFNWMKIAFYCEVENKHTTLIFKKPHKVKKHTWGVLFASSCNYH